LEISGKCLFVYVRAQVSHERSKRLLVERQREQERVEHDRALHRLESELSALRISAKHDQSERERTIVDKVLAIFLSFPPIVSSLFHASAQLYFAHLYFSLSGILSSSYLCHDAH
jgi:hypothetical protein